MGEDQSLNPDDWDKERSIEKIEDLKGQGLIAPELAYCIYTPFHEYDEDEKTMAGEIIEELQYPAGDEQGLLGTPAFQMVVAVHELSARIVEELGEESGSSSLGGRGFAADSEHDQNLSTIKKECDEAPITDATN